jgi:dihydroorotase
MVLAQVAPESAPGAAAAPRRVGAARQPVGPRPATLPPYDLLLKGGHVIDAKNNIDGLRDVAMLDGKIAAVERTIPASKAIKTVNVTGMYVVPGLIDLHTHVFTNTGERGSYAGDLSVMPDGFTFRVGVTTVVDAGGSGWKTFPRFKDLVIDRSKTRVLAMLNIVGNGMRGGHYEQDLSDMDGQATGEMALKYPGIIVGIKSAHFTGPEWKPYEQAVKAGNIANIPVMIDFGARRIERPIYKLFSDYLRPGDIYTHTYSGERGEQDNVTGGVGKGLREARAKGIYFDVGHGQASFAWSVVIPLMRDGFPPDSISTDLHIESMNAGMKDMLNVGDKFLAIGWPLKDVVAAMTWHPAHEIKQDQLGNLSVGSIADVAVLRMDHGHFGFGDSYNSRVESNEKLVCELTIKDGKFVYDLDAMSGNPWNQKPPESDKQAARWTTLKTQGFGESHWTPRQGQPLQHDWRPYTLPAKDLQTMMKTGTNAVDPQWWSPEERAKSADKDKAAAARAAARTKALADEAERLREGGSSTEKKPASKSAAKPSTAATPAAK